MLHRAYSLLTIKSVDVEPRIITGIATTPSTDRSGDIVESAGATFQLPIPLLWQHDSKQPIGEVFAATVTDAGIEIKARIASIAEPGKLKDRLDEAWQSVKSGLVRGLSIGFKSLEDADIKGTDGVRFLKWLWLELSAVTIPANAEATIHTLKSCDIGLAASGTESDPASPKHLSGVSDTRVVHVTRRNARPMKKTFSDQIRDMEATRAAKSARLEELQTTATDAGRSKDAAEKEEFDTIKAELKSIDAELVDLRDMDDLNKKAAVVVDASTQVTATESRAGIITVKENLPPGIRLARVALCLRAADGNRMEAVEIAKQRYPHEPRLVEFIKTAVAGAVPTDATWAGNLTQYQDYLGDFVEYLRPLTILGKFGTNGIPSLTRIPFNTRIKTQTATGTGYWVGAGKPAPVSKAGFGTILLQWTKVGGISVITEETARFSTPSAEMLVRNDLGNALTQVLDTSFVDPAFAGVANVSPASITNGIVAITPSGTNAAAVRADIAAIFAPFIAANITPTNGAWIMSATIALALSLQRNSLGQLEFPDITMLGGRLQGLPVIVSEYVTSLGSPSTGMMILVNASDVYLADDGQATIDVSREASIEMLDNPTNDASTGGPTTSVSMWQTESMGIKATRFVNWKLRRAAAVQYLSPVAYVG